MGQPHRWKPGESGNPKGKKKGTGKKGDIALLHQYISKEYQARGEHLVHSVIKRAYRSDKLAVAVLKKLIPDKFMEQIDLAESLYDEFTDTPFDELIRLRDKVIKAIAKDRSGSRIPKELRPLLEPQKSAPAGEVRE